MTQRFARMRYVVTGQVPARIEVRPSNRLGDSIHPDLEFEIDESWISERSADEKATTIARGEDSSSSH